MDSGKLGTILGLNIVNFTKLVPACNQQPARPTDLVQKRKDFYAKKNLPTKKTPALPGARFFETHGQQGRPGGYPPAPQ